MGWALFPPGGPRCSFPSAWVFPRCLELGGPCSSGFCHLGRFPPFVSSFIGGSGREGTGICHMPTKHHTEIAALPVFKDFSSSYNFCTEGCDFSACYVFSYIELAEFSQSVHTHVTSSRTRRKPSRSTQESHGAPSSH